jgi:hypothetical protein
MGTITSRLWVCVSYITYYRTLKIHFSGTRSVFPNLGSAEPLGSVGILKGFRQIYFRLCSMQCFSTGARLHLFIDLYPIGYLYNFII